MEMKSEAEKIYSKKTNQKRQGNTLPLSVVILILYLTFFHLSRFQFLEDMDVSTKTGTPFLLLKNWYLI